MVLYKLVHKICDGLLTTVVSDVLSNLIESLCNFILIRGEDYQLLLTY